nr:hypothetical protein [Tanacetum cinerariifolium]
EFDKFAAKEGESLESMHERLITLVNIMDRNNVCPIPVSINIKFLNYLHPEWSKYVTMDGRVNIQAKNTGYGGNGKRNARRQNMNQAFNARNGNNNGNQIVQRVLRTESNPGKAIEQILLAMKDEARSILNDEENDFMLDNSYGEETIEDLTVAVMLMDRIQPADGNAETVPSYDAKAVSEGQSIQTIHMLRKTPNKVYDPFLKAGLGYKNPERLKKAIAAQPKMYDGKRLHSAKLTIDSLDSDETLKDANEI